MDARTILPPDRLRAALQTYTVPAGNGLPEAHFSGLDPAGAVAAHMVTRDPGSALARALPDLSAFGISPAASSPGIATLDASAPADATTAAGSSTDPGAPSGSAAGSSPLMDGAWIGLGPFGALLKLLHPKDTTAAAEGLVYLVVLVLLGLALAIGGAYILATD